MKHSIALRRIHIASFAAIFGTLFGLTCTFKSDDADLQKFEKRNAYTIPPVAFSLSHTGALPKMLEGFVKDRIPFRGNLIASRSKIMYKAWDIPGSDLLVFGKNGFLFNNYKDVLFPDDVAGGKSRPFTEELLRKHAEYYLAVNEWLSYHGIPYMLVVVPTKQRVYPEFLPDGGASQFTDWTRADEMIKLLRKNNVTVVDVRDEVIKHKHEQLVFLRKDTHWNSYGAYCGYKVIFDALSKAMPGIEPVKAPIVPMERIIDNPDLGLMSRVPEHLLEKSFDLYRVYFKFKHRDVEKDLVSETEDKSAPRALVYRDSMFMNMLPFFADHFSFARYRKQYNFEAADVQKYSPNIVVQEISEGELANRFLENDLKPELEEMRLQRGTQLVKFDASNTDLNAFVMTACAKRHSGELVSNSTDPKIEFYCPTDAHSERRTLKVELTSPEKTVIQLFYSTNNAGFSDKLSVAANIQKGYNRLYFSIPADATRVRIDPCDFAGAVNLKMEVRTQPSTMLTSNPVDAETESRLASSFYQGETAFTFPTRNIKNTLLENCSYNSENGTLNASTDDPRIHFAAGDTDKMRILRACAEVSEPTTLQLFYKGEYQEFDETHSIRFPLYKGKNELFLELPREATKFRLDPSARRGDSRISFQVATVTNAKTKLAQRDQATGKPDKTY